jgi:hypothetical protein
MDKGNPALARAATTGSWSPPVASNTTSFGWS